MAAIFIIILGLLLYVQKTHDQNACLLCLLLAIGATLMSIYTHQFWITPVCILSAIILGALYWGLGYK